jgi:hypothetical protein
MEVKGTLYRGQKIKRGDVDVEKEMEKVADQNN